ncbi:primase-helicase family protein [Pedobacter cryophilus]|uniref:NrS-1 polymerase-like helicase domain-containing protein n=1 Tax=Pedobacter cryophilus TaxID=2571271 RepID=A0A4U1C1D6_9SPHI|nr:primase-helicase family protein [Pedobacter cryophilus]TKB96867.1 hypothetical protein FA046_12375 [Pedobacter cryophilus]
MTTKENESSEKPQIMESYFQTRLNSLGITPKLSFGKNPYFKETKTGNIEIQYPTLNQDIAMTKTRMNPEAGKDYNYFQSQKGNFLFFPPNVLKAYTDKTPIETLYITIGEFKAVSADVNGLHCIGISNKYAFAQGEELHPDLVQIIEELEVQNITLILDADLFSLTWDFEEEPDKDLAQNLYSYFNAISKFRLLAKEKVKSVYLSVIRERLLNNDVKGLDDLFNYKKGTEEQIIEDLNRLTTAKSYFETINLSIENLSKIKSFLHINFLKGVPADFYSKYRYLIEEKEFTFLRGKYKWDKVHEGLMLTKHADSDNYMRVGCDFLRIIYVPNSKGVLMRKLEGWKSGEIQRDYVIGLGIKNFFNTIPKYFSFCNVPENKTELYKQEIENCYNLYYPLDHKLEVGEFPKTEAFLKHIFGEAILSSGFTNYQLALDWLTIIYQEPTQKLPAICLVSKEKNTGKSTFLFWLRDIYKENATIVGNNDFNDTFNDDYISKLIIGVDESFIDKKLIMETIKSRITDEVAKIRGLYSGRREIPFVAKFVMTSNNESNFIQIDDDENRFWINRVNPYKPGTENPLLRQELIKEIPAFLNYLKNRKVLHPFKNRLYFAPDLLVNDALKKVRQSSQDWLEKEIRMIFKDKFYEYRFHTLYYTSSEILDILNGGAAGYKFRRAAVSERLEDTFKMRNDKDIRVSQPSKEESPVTGFDCIAHNFEPKRGRLYTFKIEDFYTWQHIEQYFNYCTIEEIKKFRVNNNKTESLEALDI